MSCFDVLFLEIAGLHFCQPNNVFPRSQMLEGNSKKVVTAEYAADNAFPNIFVSTCIFFKTAMLVLTVCFVGACGGSRYTSYFVLRWETIPK